ncbi:MAG: hypothetical protein ACRD5L_10650 [Bryobacteraceae bacterium]
MTLRRLILFSILYLTLASFLIVAQEDQGSYFAGTVIETAKDHLKISAVRQGKSEERQFRMTPQTKVEGRLRVRVRVTVRYVSAPEGDTATLVIIRTDPVKKKGK